MKSVSELSAAHVLDHGDQQAYQRVEQDGRRHQDQNEGQLAKTHTAIVAGEVCSDKQSLSGLSPFSWGSEEPGL